MFWPITLLGALAGWAFASIPGALLGGLLGQVLDRRLGLNSWVALRQYLQGPAGPHEQELLFMLLGRLAKADGVVRPAHIKQARNEMRRLHLSTAAQQLAIEAFGRGKSDEEALRRPLRRLRGNRDEAEHLLCACWRMAWADEQVGSAERTLIQTWGQWLGWRAADVLALEAPYVRQSSALTAMGGAEQEALRILGLAADAPTEQIKKTYRRLLSRHHPDKLAGAGATPAQVREATAITSELHRAYNLLRNRRDFR